MTIIDASITQQFLTHQINSTRQASRENIKIIIKLDGEGKEWAFVQKCLWCFVRSLNIE